MFSWKKKESKKPPRSKATPDFAIPGIPGFDSKVQEDDSDLKAELFALTGGTKSKDDDILFETDYGDDLEAELSAILGDEKRKKKKGKVSAVSDHRNKAKTTTDKLQRGASILTNDNEDDDDIDENDPELLSELEMLTINSDSEVEEEEGQDGDNEEEVEVIPSQLEVIKARLIMYKDAENAAKAASESARARRFNRGYKTLEKLLRRAEAGEVVPNDEIPPELAQPPTQPKTKNISNLSDTLVNVPTAKDILDNSPVNPIKEVIEETSNQDVLPTVAGKQAATIDASDDTEVDPVADTIPETNYCNERPTPNNGMQDESQGKVGETVQSASEDLVLLLLKRRREEFKICALNAKKRGDMPAALENVRNVKLIEKLILSREAGNTIDDKEIPNSPANSPPQPKIMNQAQLPSPTRRAPAPPTSPKIVPPIPKTIIDALNQRLEYFSKAAKKAETLGQRPVAKKCNDYVRLYQNAIILHNKGKNLPYEKLPTPPGYPPIPLRFAIP